MNLPASAGDLRGVGSIPGLGRSPGGGHGNPLQYSCLENPMDRGAWWAIVHRVAKSQTQLKQHNTHTMVLYISKTYSLPCIDLLDFFFFLPWGIYRDYCSIGYTLRNEAYLTLCIFQCKNISLRLRMKSISL